MSNFNPQELDKWFEAARKEPLMLDKETAKNLLEQPRPDIDDSHVFTFKNILIMLGSISTLVLSLYFLLPSVQESPTNSPVHSPTIKEITLSPEIDTMNLTVPQTQPTSVEPVTRVPQTFPIIRPSMETLAKIGFNYQKDQTHFMTIAEGRWAMMLTFQIHKGEESPTMLMSGEPLESTSTQIERKWIDGEMYTILDRGFYPMYAVDQDQAEVFAQTPRDFHQPYFAYIPVKAPVSLRPSKSRDSVIYYFTPTEALFDMLPVAQGQQLREIYDRAKIDASRNIYLYRPMHIETFLSLSKAQFQNLGFTYDDGGCLDYHENVHHVGEVRFKQAWINGGIEWSL